MGCWVAGGNYPFTLKDGDFSVYNITNEEAFFEQIENIFEQIEEDEYPDKDTHEEWDYETELIQVIEEYRDELLAGEDVGIYYAQSLLHLAKLRLEQEKSTETMNTLREVLKNLELIHQKNIPWYRTSIRAKFMLIRILCQEENETSSQAVEQQIADLKELLKTNGLEPELHDEFKALLIRIDES